MSYSVAGHQRTDDTPADGGPADTPAGGGQTPEWTRLPLTMESRATNESSINRPCLRVLVAITVLNVACDACMLGPLTLLTEIYSTMYIRTSRRRRTFVLHVDLSPYF